MFSSGVESLPPSHCWQNTVFALYRDGSEPEMLAATCVFKVEIEELSCKEHE